MTSPHKETLYKVTRRKFHVMKTGIDQLIHEVGALHAAYKLPRKSPADTLVLAVIDELKDLQARAKNVRVGDPELETTPDVNAPETDESMFD